MLVSLHRPVSGRMSAIRLRSPASTASAVLKCARPLLGYPHEEQLGKVMAIPPGEGPQPAQRPARSPRSRLVLVEGYRPPSAAGPAGSASRPDTRIPSFNVPRMRMSSRMSQAQSLACLLRSLRSRRSSLTKGRCPRTQFQTAVEGASRARPLSAAPPRVGLAAQQRMRRAAIAAVAWVTVYRAGHGESA